jgi:hypothetical protein
MTIYYMKGLLITLLLTVATADIQSQEVTTNPPYPTNNPYASRGNPTSPNGRYAWVVAANSTVTYQLMDRGNGKTLATIKSYFADSGGPEALRYARAVGVYWNEDSNLVALDELNYRRAGYLYFFSLQDGRAKQIDISVPKPSNADETRMCADKGWISPEKFSIRQAVKLKNGNFKSDYCNIDFADLNHPNVQPEESRDQK